MKDFYHTIKTNLFRLFLVAIVATVATSARAAVTDLGELEFGKEYTLDSFAGYTATIKTTVAGAYEIVEPQANTLTVYTDEAHTDNIAEQNGSYVNGWTCTVTLEANTTYYLYSKFLWQGGTFKISSPEETSIEIARINHVDNSAYSIADGGRLDVTFSTGVTFDNVAIATGSTTVGVTDYQISNANVMVNLGETLKKWYADGTIAAEQKFTVTFSGLRSAADDTKLYNGDGSLVLTYYAAAAPTEMTSATNADGSVTLTNGTVASVNFLSYFTPTNVNGKYIFTFSQAIDPTSGEVKLQYGNAEADDFYEEVLTPTYSNDNTVITVDLSGKVRRAKDMTSSTYTQIALVLSHIKGADGEYVATDTQGGVGSFYFTFPYVEVESNVAVDWGESESLSDQLEIYVSNYADIEYDGIKFSWYESGAEVSEVVDKTNLTIVTDNAGGATITVNVPAAAKSITDVTVSFNNLYVADGLDHTKDLTKVYNPTLEILASTPAQGAEIESIKSGSTVGVTLNRSDLGYVQYEIYDLNPDDPDDACVSSRATLKAVEGQAGVYTATRYGADLKCIKGHTYRFDVLGWAQESDARGTGYSNPAARASFTFSGTTEVFTFSPVKLVSIDPENGTTLTSADQNEFVITFDDLVKVDSDKSFVNLGQGATAAFESVTAVNGNGDYSKTWSVVVPASTMSTITDGLTLTIVATDVNDKLVEGNEGVEANSYFKFEYQATFNNPDIIFTPESGSIVESLSSVTAYYGGGLGFSWNGTSISVYKGREYITTLTDDNIEEGEYDSSNTYSFIIQLPEAITEAGTYQIIIPEGYFLLGEYGNYKSKAYTLSYTIEDKTPAIEFAVATTPADGATVDACDNIELTFTPYGTAGLGNGKAILTKKGSDTVTHLSDAGWGVELNQMVQSLDGAAAENGTYTVTFPAGYFLLGQNEDDDNPVDSPEFSITFTVGTEAPEQPIVSLNITSDPADGSTVASCDQIDIIFNDYNEVGIGGGKATISKDGGDAISLGDAQYGTAWNEAIQPLEGTAAEEGTYTVTFPAGYFILDDTDSPEFSITFTVGTDAPANTVAYTVSPNPEDGLLSELKTFTLTFEEPIASLNYTNLPKIGVSYDYQVTNFDIENDSYSISGNSITFTFANAFTEEGSYMINIPAGTIFLGDWGDIENTEIYIRYGVGGTQEAPTFNVVSDPADGSTVASCSQIYLTFPDWESVAEASGKATISKDGGAAIELDSTQWGVGMNEIIQPLGYEATSNATYVVTFPAGYFQLAKIGVDDSYSPLFTITFTVDSSTGISTIGVDEAGVRYFNLQGVEVKNPTNGVYIIVNGNKVSKEVIK